MNPDRKPHIDFRTSLSEATELQAPSEADIAYIRDRLPNARKIVERDIEILNNEYAIRRWIGEE